MGWAACPGARSQRQKRGRAAHSIRATRASLPFHVLTTPVLTLVLVLCPLPTPLSPSRPSLARAGLLPVLSSPLPLAPCSGQNLTASAPATASLLPLVSSDSDSSCQGDVTLLLSR